MMDYPTIKRLAQTAGFSHIAPLDPATIQLKPEVRQMCAACSQYGKRWSCPPECGSLEECAKQIGTYRQGVLVQTVGILEDAFDGEGMLETESLHKQNFRKLRDLIGQADVLALGAGCCTMCSDCTCPETPCRFPEKRISSMEAYGIVVTEVCRANGVPYRYEENTIAYTSCVLF